MNEEKNNIVLLEIKKITDLVVPNAENAILEKIIQMYAFLKGQGPEPHIQDIYKAFDEKFHILSLAEQTHTYIQFMAPANEPSAYNRHIFFKDKYEFLLLESVLGFATNGCLLDFVIRFFKWLGFNVKDGEVFINFESEFIKNTYLNDCMVFRHDLLRITRILRTNCFFAEVCEKEIALQLLDFVINFVNFAEKNIDRQSFLFNDSLKKFYLPIKQRAIEIKSKLDDKDRLFADRNIIDKSRFKITSIL